jgi:Family of unknown function (DUF6335)
MPAKKKAKKTASKKKKLASAKKSASKSKKTVKKSAGSKKGATKLKKSARAKKPASKKKPAAKARQKPEPQQGESFFVDAGRLETEIYEPNPEVKVEFAEAAVLGDPSRRALLNELRENPPAESSVLSGGDVDAAWDQSDASGEETVGGSNPTPDQDIVEDLGKAAGLTYQDDEPLDPNEKVAKRDRQRWELEPESSEDFEERNN